MFAVNHWLDYVAFCCFVEFTKEVLKYLWVYGMTINTTTFFIKQRLKPFTGNFCKVSENYLWRSSFLIKLQLGRQQICPLEEKIWIIVFNAMLTKHWGTPLNGFSWTLLLSKGKANALGLWKFSREV